MSRRWFVAGLAVAWLIATGGCARADGAFVGVASPTPSSTSSPAETVTITGVGDVIMGSTPKLPPNGGATFFDDVSSALRGDVVMGNLESSLTDRTHSTKCAPPPTPRPTPTPTASATPAGGCFAFRVPPSYAHWLGKAGFTLFNVANNHSRDYGSGGLDDTVRALGAVGVKTTGFAGKYPVEQVRGIKIAVLGFSPYSWTNSLLDVGGAAKLVRQAAAQADLVVVNMHVGGEGADRTHVRPGPETFLGENRGDALRFAHAVVDAGADLVVGHSPHVMRGMEFYKGRLIAYSMGNFAGYRTLSTVGPLGVGGVLSVRLQRDGTWVGGTLTATHLVNRGLPALDPSHAALTLVGRLSTEDFGTSAATISRQGAISP